MFPNTCRYEYFFLVLACGTRAQSLYAPFSYVLDIRCPSAHIKVCFRHKLSSHSMSLLFLLGSTSICTVTFVLESGASIQIVLANTDLNNSKRWQQCAWWGVMSCNWTWHDNTYMKVQLERWKIWNTGCLRYDIGQPFRAINISFGSPRTAGTPTIYLQPQVT
jgi:hypothetical protein